MKRINLITLASIIGLAACQKDDQEVQQSPGPGAGKDITELNVPDGFHFETARDIQAQVSVKGLQDQPLGGKRVMFYTEDPNQGAAPFAAGVTDPAGMLDMAIQVPAYAEQVFVQVQAAGFNNLEKIAIAPSIKATFGGKPQPRAGKRGKMGTVQSSPIPISGNYYYMGSFTSGRDKGLPAYLEATGDNLSQSFLDEVNASLPESQPVPSDNPSYLASGNELDVVVKEKSDVWITFVTEGAGYRNALGYYVYDSNNPPSSPAQIDSIHVILPNASLSSSGGQLNAGDKVKLGTFPAGKTISWVLFQDAYTGRGVNVNATKFYSKPSFNNAVESDNSKNQHTVQLADIGRELLLNGFEDQTRSRGSDNDFNDLIWYVTANPWEGVDIGNIPPTTPSEDDDNDGVGNEGDDFPNDPTRAVSNNFSGTLAYEDLWPNQGDYDFNDLVLDYQIEHVLNSGNKLVEINADWTVKAIGAAYANGFGFQFKNIIPNVVSGVTGQDLSQGIVNNNANGTESGQRKATVIVFENARDVMPSTAGFINTRPGTTPVNPQTVSNGITFNSPQDQSKVGLPPYNPFIFANGTRGREVHLAGKDATTLANASLFGTGDDASTPTTGVTYQNAQNLPWAIHVKGNFKHPQEQTAITTAYNFFAQWATSGGSQYADWFTDQPGYRNAAELY